MALNKIVISICLSLLVCSCGIVYGQKISENNLSGNLYLDANVTPPALPQTVSMQILSDVNKLNVKEEKSPVLAGILSGILPGAGEFYTGQYLKAAIFLAVETASITTAIIYTHKGNYQTAFFEWYNNQHWSPVRYAQWTIANAKSINPKVDPTQYNVFNSNGSLNWSELNRLESALGTTGNPTGYSHELAVFGSQDFYEITGKYPQFVSGWDTFTNPNYIDFNNYVLPQMLWYAHQRGVANSLYQTASFFIGTIFVNHFLSILDAVWSTHTFNSRIAMNVSVQNVNLAGGVDICPAFNISYNF
ncbi:MAG: hypothetical protein ABR980_06275 [Ignavibacteriaceae bacterium]|jgi:hypothetical protein